jgi:predicted GNAT superfamily acetyltransferase
MGHPEIRIAGLSEIADFERCVELQLAVWGYSDGDVIPKRVFIVARRIGGQVIGAFDDDAGGLLVGFCLSLPGYREGRAYLHSHMLAVREGYRNAGVGRRLKLAQREDALARGIGLMEWTFDPLEIKNAHLNIARLGAISRRYLADFYGHSSSPLQGGLATDRLVAEWWLGSARVGRALGEEAGGEGGPEQWVEQVVVPQGVYAWKRDPGERGLAEAVQARNRGALESAFARGLTVIGYTRSAEGDGCFLLGRLTGLEEAG